jgi:hypothetical protein
VTGHVGGAGRRAPPRALTHPRSRARHRPRRLVDLYRPFRW